MISPLWLLYAGTAIIVAGKPVEVGRPVVLWNEPEGFDGYAETCVESQYASTSKCCTRPFKRFGERRAMKKRTLEELRAVVSQFVLHLDGCVNSRSCFYSMHDTARPDGGCGLSAHFMVDADGTIYQTLDVLESAWHAEQSNGISIGVEICNRGDAGRNELHRLPAEYRTRPVRDVVINGRTIHAFDFRPEQYESVVALARALVRQLPGIKPVFPEKNGVPLLETLTDPLGFKGIVGHLHVDKQKRKWDPGAFDWMRLKNALNGYHFPVVIGTHGPLGASREALHAAAKAAYRNIEERSSAFFPMGPGRLWHSGVHLRAPAGEPVHAPARGRVIAARLSDDAGAGRSFVLIKHQLALPEGTLVYYSLLAHLAATPVSDKAKIAWLRDLAYAGGGGALRELRAGRVALLDQPVEAGDVVGHVGAFRRGSEGGSEVHFEIFSTTRLPGELGKGLRYIEAGPDGPLVRRGALVDPIDGDHDGQITGEELRTFFRSENLSARQAMRHLAVRHAHEWGERLTENDFVTAPELTRLPQADRRAVYRAAIAPYRFWSDALSAHAGLPSNQVVYSYHPITVLIELAARAADTKLSWPARASFVVRDLEPQALPVAGYLDWTSPRAAAEEPTIFGPVMESEVAPRRRADIPLIVLPSAHQ